MNAPIIKKVTFLRSHDTDRNYNILLGGDSRWIRDLELLLEDQWKNIFCPEDFGAYQKTISEHPPKICVIELDAYQGNDIKSLDLISSKGTECMLITHSVQDMFSWQRTQRSMAVRGVKCLELSAEPRIAFRELDDVLSGMCAAGFALEEDLQMIQNAFQGFLVAGGNETPGLSKVFKALASKFVFDPNDIVTGSLLVETYSLWKQLKEANSDLQVAYLNAQSTIIDQNIVKLIEFSRKCYDYFQIHGALDGYNFRRMATESNFGRLTVRKIENSISEVQGCLGESIGGLRLVGKKGG